MKTIFITSILFILGLSFPFDSNAELAQKQAQIPGGWLRLESGVLYFSGQIKREGEFLAGGTINSGNTEYTTVYETFRSALRLPGVVLDLEEVDGFIHILLQEKNILGQPTKKRLLVFHESEMVYIINGMLISDASVKEQTPGYYILCGLTALEACSSIEAGVLSLGTILLTGIAAKLWAYDVNPDHHDGRFGVHRTIKESMQYEYLIMDPQDGLTSINGVIDGDRFLWDRETGSSIATIDSKTNQKDTISLKDISKIVALTRYLHPDSCSHSFLQIKQPPHPR